MLNYVLDKNGKYVTNDGYQEIIKLHEMLEKANIPHTFKKFLNGWQVCYPTDNRRKIVADAVEHYGSYGQNKDLLEIMGLLTPEEQKNDSVLGYLTAEEVFRRMSEHYRRAKA